MCKSLSPKTIQMAYQVRVIRMLLMIIKKNNEKKGFIEKYLPSFFL